MRRLLLSAVWFCLVRVSEGSLEKRGGPSGYLITPNDGTVWDNTYGFGLGHVLYQGVNQPYSYEDITHVHTTSIDIYLQAEDGSTVYYLARGLNPNPDSLMVDESFRIPYTSGNYQVVINETQECQTSSLPPIIFQAAAPTVTIISNSTSTTKRSLFADLGDVGELAERGGPSGSLVIPDDGTVWDDTNGFGSGRVLYQGVDQDYYFDNITHVTTHVIDVWVETDDTSPPYFLAKGIAPKNLTVDVSFQIPRALNGSYYLVVNETQECQSPTMPPIIFKAAAPYITVLPTETSNTAPSSGSSSLPIRAIVGGVVGGVAFIVLIGLLVWLLLRSRRRDAQQAEEREARGVNRPDVPTSPLEPSFIVTPFDLSMLSSAPPEYTPSANITPLSTPSKSRFSSPPTTPDANRTSFGTTLTRAPSHSHTRSTSSGASAGSSSYFDNPVQPLLMRSTSSVNAAVGHPTRPSSTFVISGEAPSTSRPPREPMSPQGLSRYPAALEPVYEQHIQQQLADVPMEESVEHEPMPPPPPPKPSWTYTDSGGVQMAQTYRPGDIIPQHFVGR